MSIHICESKIHIYHCYMKSQISTKSLKRLRSQLPLGAINTIAERVGVTQSTVSKALNGKGKTINTKILEAAIHLCKEHKARVAELEAQISE